MTLLVPETYATIAAATEAASAGDTISLAPGVHEVSATIVRAGKEGVRLRSRNPSDPAVIEGTGTSGGLFGGLAVNGWNFYDLHFRWTGGWRVSDNWSNDSFFGCTFDQSNRLLAVGTSVIMLSGGAAGSPRPTIVRGCSFIGREGVGSARAVYGSLSATNTSHVIVEGCLFFRWNIYFSQAIRTFGTRLAGSSYLVRNNTFLDCSRVGTNYTGFIASGGTFGAGSTIEVSNNLLENVGGTLDVTHRDINLNSPGSDNVWQVRNSSRRYSGADPAALPAFTLIGGSSAGEQDLVTSVSTAPWLHSPSARPLQGVSEVVGRGHPTMRCRVDLRRRETGLVVGAVAYVDATPRLHVKWQRVPMLGGFVVTLGGSPVALPAVTYQSFDSPDALALWLSRELDTLQDVEVFYSQHGHYMVHATTSTVGLSTSGTARALMGPVTEVVEDTLYRTEEDAATLTLEQLLDEDVEGDENRAQTVSTTGVGAIVVQPFPTGARRPVFSFTVLSDRLDAENFQRVIQKYLAGREMRVWRSLGNDEPWGLTNRSGYSDMTPQAVGPSYQYDWYNPQRSRLETVLSGVGTKALS